MNQTQENWGAAYNVGVLERVKRVVHVLYMVNLPKYFTVWKTMPKEEITKSHNCHQLLSPNSSTASWSCCFDGFQEPLLGRKMKIKMLNFIFNANGVGPFDTTFFLYVALSLYSKDRYITTYIHKYF